MATMITQSDLEIGIVLSLSLFKFIDGMGTV